MLGEGLGVDDDGLAAQGARLHGDLVAVDEDRGVGAEAFAWHPAIAGLVPQEILDAFGNENALAHTGLCQPCTQCRMHVGAVELGGELLVKADDADLLAWIVGRVAHDGTEQRGRGIASLMHGDDIGFEAHAGGRTEIDAGGLEGGFDGFERLPARCGGPALDRLDGRKRHPGRAGELGLAPFEKRAGGTYLSVVYHDVSISS